MRLLVCGLILFGQTCAFAQEPLTAFRLVPDKAIKVSPLHLLNFYPTIELSYEQKVFTRFTTQFEMGFVLDYPSSVDESFQNKRGVKIKLEGRYYFTSSPDRERIYYTAFEPYFNAINFDRNRVFTECFDLECNHRFTREYAYKTRYREQGINLKAGIVRYLGRAIFLDFNSGLSLRHVDYDSPNTGSRSVIDDMWPSFQIPNENDRLALSPNMGFRLGYRFR
ncbi:MAG: hypothetical protein WEB30_07175 [Cyclobacteriaceae bacterium]